MSSLYTPISDFAAQVQMPENGDKGNALTFKTPLKTLANMAKYLLDRADSASSLISMLTTRTDAWTWLTTNNVPELTLSNGVLGYVGAKTVDIVLPHTEAICPPNSVTTFDIYQNFLRLANPGGSHVERLVYFPLRLPEGTVITRIRARVEQTTSTPIVIKLIRNQMDFSFTEPQSAVVTSEIMSASTGVTPNEKVVGNTSMSYTVSGPGTDTLIVQVALQAAASDVTGDKLYGVFIRCDYNKV